MSENLVCCTTFPDVNELLCIFATITNNEEAKISDHNRTILKCRQILYEISDVIVCPVLENIYGIYIVMKESSYGNGLLTTCLQKLRLKASTPAAVQKHIYEDCCTYSITAKLAPKWNVISNYLLRGRDFLINNDPSDYIRLLISITDKGDVSLALSVGRIKMPDMSLKKLDLTENQLQQLALKNRIYFRYNDLKIVRVLPSLKRGHIISISTDLNKLSDIKTYNQMRRHWKNTYGYRLPESDVGIYYLDISFFDGSPVFTYPHNCVRLYEPCFLQPTNPELVADEFIADMLKMVPTVLGDKYPVPSYISKFSHKSVKTITPLVNKIPNPNSAFIFLPAKQLLNHSNNGTKNLSQFISDLNTARNIPETPNSISSFRSELTCNSIQNQLKDQLQFLNSKDDIKKKLESDEEYVGKTEKQKTESLAEYIPKFTPKFPVKISQNNENQKTESLSEYIPKFTPKFPAKRSQNNTTSNAEISTKTNIPIQNLEYNHVKLSQNITVLNNKNDAEYIPNFSKSEKPTSYFTKNVTLKCQNNVKKASNTDFTTNITKSNFPKKLLENLNKSLDQISIPNNENNTKFIPNFQKNKNTKRTTSEFEAPKCQNIKKSRVSKSQKNRKPIFNMSNLKNSEENNDTSSRNDKLITAESQPVSSVKKTAKKPTENKRQRKSKTRN